MDLVPYLYKLLPKLADTGSTVSLEGTYELDRFDKGVRSFSLKEGIAFTLDFTNTGGAVLIMGSVQAHVSAECDRCLEPASQMVIGEVEGYAVFSESALDEQAQADEYLCARGTEGIIDLAPLLFSALILALPVIFLCSEDCAGICATCGAHLNKETCECATIQHEEDHVGEADEPDENHPFAALKNLL